MASIPKPARREARVRISKSGQITLPADIRRELGVGVGDMVAFRRDSDGAIRLEPVQHLNVDELMAMAKPLPDGTDLEQILRDARRFGGVRQRYLSDDDKP